MKESERKLQWCPHRRTTISFDPPGPPAQNVTVAGNARTDGPLQVEIGTCIGSACSQWRWDDDGLIRIAPPRIMAVTWMADADGNLVRSEPLPRPADAADPLFVWFARLEMWIRPHPAGARSGHCGLSGAAAYD